MSISQKILTSALAELGAELGISDADIGGKVKIEGKDLRRFKANQDSGSQVKLETIGKAGV